MFEAKILDNGEVALTGRFDASQDAKARQFFEQVTTSAVVNFKDLEYISSAGLGVLLMTQKRLSEHGGGLKLINMNKHIRDVFMYAGFDRIFQIE
jgi:anti-sigma B factor antagonist